MQRLLTSPVRVAVIAACLAAGLLAGAFANAGLRRVDTPTTIHACKLVPSGLLRIVDEPSDCRRHERHLELERPGPGWPPGTARCAGDVRGSRPSRTTGISRPGRANRTYRACRATGVWSLVPRQP